MDSSINNEISNKETLLEKLPSPRITKHKNLKPLYFLALLISLVLVATFTITLSSLPREISRSKHAYSYQSNLIRHYCDLTPYPILCYDSMSPIVNTKALESGPGPIFSTSFQVATDQLHDVMTKIARSNNSQLSLCRTWARDSLEVNLIAIEALTFMETENFTRAWRLAAAGDRARECSSSMREGAEEVRLGVEKAIKCMMNSVGLLEKREYIIYDFYDNPHSASSSDFNNYDADPFSFFMNRFTVCLYSAMYMCLALLCFLFCRTN